MGVLSTYELWDGRQGRDTFTKRRTYTRVFEVYTSNPFDNAAVAGSSLLLPRLMSRYPGDNAAVCTAVIPVQDSNDPRRWIVSCEYDSQPDWPKPEGDPGDGNTDRPQPVENPLDRPPAFKVSFQQRQVVARTAGNYDPKTGANLGSKAIKDSCGLPFDPPVMIDTSQPIITVTVNRPVFSMTMAEQLQDAVNQKEWQGFNPRVLRCIGIEASNKFEQNRLYWEVEYRLAVQRETWDARTLDAGFQEFWQPPTPPSGPRPPIERRPIKDNWGGTPTNPVPLNGFGYRLNLGTPDAPGDPEVYLTWRVYPERDYSTLIF